MKAYSQDLRERVLRAVDLGCPRAEIVHLFGVSLSSIKRGSVWGDGANCKRREEFHAT